MSEARSFEEIDIDHISKCFSAYDLFEFKSKISKLLGVYNLSNALL